MNKKIFLVSIIITTIILFIYFGNILQSNIFQECDFWVVHFKTLFNETNNQYSYTNSGLKSVTNKEVLDDIVYKKCINKFSNDK